MALTKAEKSALAYCSHPDNCTVMTVQEGFEACGYTQELYSRLGAAVLVQALAAVEKMPPETDANEAYACTLALMFEKGIAIGFALPQQRVRDLDPARVAEALAAFRRGDQVEGVRLARRLFGLDQSDLPVDESLMTEDTGAEPEADDPV